RRCVLGVSCLLGLVGQGLGVKKNNGAAAQFAGGELEARIADEDLGNGEARRAGGTEHGEDFGGDVLRERGRIRVGQGGRENAAVLVHGETSPRQRQQFRRWPEEYAQEAHIVKSLFMDSSIWATV